jgi:hypothetical protein
VELALKKEMLTGRIEAGQANKDRAKQLAELTYLACLKEGAEGTKDYWCVATKLEAAFIAGVPPDQIIDSLDAILKMNVPDWQIQTTRDSILGVAGYNNPETVNIIVEKLNEKIENVVQNQVASEKNQTNNSAGFKKAEMLKTWSYNYRGFASNFEGANYIGGNTKFGGQLPDHSISRKDIEIFDGLLGKPIEQLFPEGKVPDKLKEYGCLKDINNAEEFLDATNSFIRFHFGTENFAGTGLNLENNAEHKDADGTSAYDRTVKSLFYVAGKENNKEADSRTSISAMFALGLGDCRHHAQVKQLMFDRWQGEQMNGFLMDAYEASNKGDTAAYNSAVEKFYDTCYTELRTIDVCICAPVEIDKIYEPNKTSDGKYIKGSSGCQLEDHTMNILIKTNREGELNDCKIVDSFYHNNYDWANHDVGIGGVNIKTIKEKQWDGTFAERQVFEIDAGNLDGSKVDTDESLPIKIIPTVYGKGQREEQSPDTGDHLTILGTPTKIDSVEDITNILQNREDMENILNRFRSFHMQQLQTADGPSQQMI